MFTAFSKGSRVQTEDKNQVHQDVSRFHRSVSRFHQDVNGFRQVANRFGVAFCAIAFSVNLFLAPAEAYSYFPYSYGWGLGSLLYPLSYLAYPFYRGPSSYYYAPYWAQRAVQRSMRGALYNPYAQTNPYAQNPNGNQNMDPNGSATGNGNGQDMNAPYGIDQYSDEEPVNAPRRRKRPKRVPPPQAVDQIAHANWNLDPSTSDEALLDKAAAAQAGTYPAAQQNGSYPAFAPQAVAPQAVTPPMVAPQPTGKKHRFSKHRHSESDQSTGGTPPPAENARAPQATYNQNSQYATKGQIQTVGANSSGFALSRSAQPISTCAPLADGFVTHVNTRYAGDIKAALFDPETRSYARVLGLVNEDALFGADLSDARVQLIKSVLQDQTMDSVSKLQAVKIMIGAKAAR